IADTFAVWATNGFDVATTLNLFEAWATSLSYTFQLYFDFSGYTDMAIGLALLFNIRLPVNFNSPYKATNIQDFWRRWHITLSRFLRDYVYIPLGGNRKGGFRTYNNLMATFVLGGLWHGAAWTFVFWGFLHGLALIIQRIWSKLGIKLWTWLAWLITFNFVNITWVFFRAKEWDDAVKVLSGMVGLSGVYIENLKLLDLIKLNPDTLKLIPLLDGIARIDLAIYIMIAILSVIILFFKNSIELLANFETSKFNLYLGLTAFLVSILFMNSIQETEFLYFDF
ncbi:MBOAT family protein, partial [Candidatus Woesearchaeota archaeon]|nr:MBOAT family protein [Candidatus Woesearchaeota archaeon]